MSKIEYIVKNYPSNKLKIASKGFPTLMKNKSGSIFLVNKAKEDFWLVCVSPDIGDTFFGSILKTSSKGMKNFTEMKKGFFIELQRTNK
jgi:hypothetical protein